MKEKGVLTQGIVSRLEVVLIAVNCSAIHLHTIGGGKGYSCIKTFTEKNGHVCCKEWCGSKRAVQKEGFESGYCFNN
ncbi:BAQ_1a_G0027670.mRNA.1.CDS.1 [Saccharomyces cerevisiae]|nr:BAQ_1a_G0027670.mRNA.1.CDS.1 [Saccharomyces cerevisiae]CAI7162750.1 BAQ_1a_G0027670.mRNA.1.CDS.1 [Saccharomyces cerevisiae]